MNYMPKKKRNNKKLILLVLTIIMCLGVSYAAIYFVYFKEDSRINKIETGLVTIDYVEGNGEINLTNTLPVLDEVGLASEPYSFTVKNTSAVPINLKVELIPDSENTLHEGAIRYGLYKDGELIQLDYLQNLENNILYLYQEMPKGKTIEFKLYIWVDYYYETPNETFKAQIKVTGESYDVIYEPPATDTIKEKVVSYSVASASDFGGGLVAINGTEGTDYGLLYNDNNETHTIREYRYSGPNVNNYIYYNCPDTAGGYNYGDVDYPYEANCEVWRIVGIFKENDEEYLKIMRNTILTGIPTTYVYNNTTYTVGNNGTTAYWNKKASGTNNSDWTTAGLQYYLNTEKDNSATPVAGYLSTVSSTSKNLIRETTYYLGNVAPGPNGDTTLTAYNNERDENNIRNGNQPTWDGKIGLLYPSDVGYSASPTYWSQTKLYEYYGTAVKASNWMQQTHSTSEWFLSPSSYSSSNVISWSSSGSLHVELVYNFGVRPVLNLKSQTEILIGDGTSNSPYVVIEQ